MLRAFFDEAGLNPDSDTALVVAGFLGQAEHLDLASNTWSQRLDGKRFKHSKADTCEILDLAKIIAQFPLQGYCVYLRHQSLADRDIRSMKGVVGRRPYDWAFLAAIDVVLEHVEQFNDRETVNFVFDHRTELNACTPPFNRIKQAGIKTSYRCAGKCSSSDDEKTAALQMADLLAGEYFRRKKTGRLSEALHAIIEAHGLFETISAPLPMVNSAISLIKSGTQLTRDLVACLVKTKTVNEVKLPRELADQFYDLLKKSAYHRLQIDKYMEQLELDTTYQEIKKIYGELLNNDV